MEKPMVTWGAGEGGTSGGKGTGVLPGGRGGNFFSYFYFPAFSKGSLMNMFCFCLRKKISTNFVLKKEMHEWVSGPLETEYL